MKHLIHLLSCLFLAILCLGCSDEEYFDGPPSQPSEGILLRLTNGSLEEPQTKTNLQSTANLHHIREVHVCLYRLNENKTDGKLVVDPQKLDWTPVEEDNYGADAIQIKQFLMKETETLVQGTYTLLCIGLDTNKDPQDTAPNSATTYNLPAALKKGSNLSEAKALLASGKTKEDIAHSELFAGWETFSYNPGRLSEVDVELRRRVAGVICYLTDIPYTITDTKGTRRITRVVLRLCQPQNRSVALKRVLPTVGTDGKPIPADDFGENPFDAVSTDYGQSLSVENIAASETLLSFDMADWGKGGKQSDKNLYITDIQDKLGDKYLPNTLFGGLYLLPLQRTVGSTDATLQVELWGKEVVSVDDDPAVDAAETFIKAFPACYEEAVGTEQTGYSIRPNYVYHIGQKPAEDNTVNDLPESLAGSKIDLDVEDWTYKNINVEYPSVPIFTTMDFEKGYTENYIFDASNSVENILVYPSLEKNAWKLSVIDSVEVDGKKVAVPLNGFLYFKQPDGSYKTSYSSDKTAEKTTVEMLMMDYAEYRDYGGKDIIDYLEQDYRKGYIVLETLDGAGKVTRAQTIPVKQYNAITIAVRKENKGNINSYRGFARYDYGTVRDTNGEIVKLTGADVLNVTYGEYKQESDLPARYNDGLGLAMGWGYWEYYRGLQYTGDQSDYDGQRNRQSIYDQINNGTVEGGYFREERKAYWKECAVNATAWKRYDLDAQGVPTASENYWYMPACYEIESFLYFAKDYTEQLHVKVSDNEIRYTSDDVCQGYWTSGDKYGIDIGNTYTYYLCDNAVRYRWIRSTLRLYTRQACHLTDAPNP